MRVHLRFFLFLIICLFVSHLHAQLIMKRICFLQSGQYTKSDGRTICFDSNHNGVNELIYRTGRRTVPSDPIRWEVLEYRPNNHYEVVFVDTGVNAPYPPGITTGNFQPYDVGDIDNDSFTDLVGPNTDQPLNPDTIYFVVTTQETPEYSFFPSILSWWHRYSDNYLGNGSQPFYYLSDLDSDGRNEIIFASPSESLGVVIFENIANNQNIVVWNMVQEISGWAFTYGDFDIDGYKEFVTAGLETSGRVYVYENIGDNQYGCVFVDTVHLPNGSDVFSGNDCDSDGWSEFFVGFKVVSTSTYYLYMWEASGNNTYHRTLVTQRTDGGGYYSSKCGDIDGDGIDEIIWAIGTKVVVYKATGNNQFQPVWTWNNDHGGACTIVNIYDMNQNSYNEIVVGGAGKTSLFELEAIRLLRPNGGETFQPDSQYRIRWLKFYPPRCDSLSLFYSTDNGNNYAMITHGLSGNDTSYLWTVPNANSDSCKVKIIAYGPGWQYDESDGVFRISATGIEEIATLPLAMTLGLQVLPNPAKSFSNIHYSLPVESKVSLNLYDISGRLIKTLVNENKQPGNYSLTLNTKTLSSGVYFLSLQTEDKRIIERLVVVK